MIDKETVKKVADLARLQLSDSEVESTADQFNKILNYFKELQEVNTEGVTPMVTPHDLNTALRVDEVKKDLTVDELLSNAPDVNNSLFKVPPVV